MKTKLKMTINNKEVDFIKGETIYQVAKKAGLFIPTLCYMEGYKPSGACRICVVEDVKTGRLIASCSYPAESGMEVRTDSPQVRMSRKKIIELLLSNHPQDCLTCTKSGACLLQNLSKQYGVDEIAFQGGAKKKAVIDKASPSVERDMAKCILCGRCVTVCSEKQGVSAIDFSHRGFSTQVAPGSFKSLAEGNCVSCGQCIMACPVGALHEISHKKLVIDAIINPNKKVALQFAPACQMTFPEYFKKSISVDDATKKIIGALRSIGVNFVFDTCTAADITIVEEAKELVERLTKKNKPLPMFTSCCPAWINFIETFYPKHTKHLSSCKSPHMMKGALIKHLSEKLLKTKAKDLFVVSVMPCVAKKSETGRPQLENEGMANVDAVLTTRELFSLLDEFGIQYEKIQDSDYDRPFANASGAGKIFGATGGVMEAAIRTAYYYVTGKELDNVDYKPVRGMSEIKRATVDIAGTQVNVAVVNGLGNVVDILEDISAGKSDLHFIEVMSCPSGCVGGAGQPYNTDAELLKSRTKTTYKEDENSKIRRSHENPDVIELYDKHINEHEAHDLLHTRYKGDK
ncbi:MAG: NADP-reducing hydrogenase subunit HndC [bacterium ADurb.Bin243]|nr:MAG: NADP-reducing hydrogenase subunit HndC [bacterium ADurb.Bin243]